MIGRLTNTPWPRARRHTLAYTPLPRRIRRRRSSAAPAAPRAPGAPAVNTGETMIFDRAPAALPEAKLRPRELDTRLWAEVRAWLLARWAWLRPRWIPVVAAIAGLIGSLASAKYLSEYTEHPPRPYVYPSPASTFVSDELPDCARLTGEAQSDCYALRAYRR